MADVNSFAFTGHLTADAAMRNTSTGKQVLTFPIAVNTGFGQTAKTLFIKVQQWGARSANVLPYLKKGTLVGGSGELNLNQWTSQDGVQHNDLVVTVFGFQLLGSKKDSETPSATSEPASASSPDSSPEFSGFSDSEEISF